jgi:flagellar hook assembly protein FlgD
MTLPPFPYIIKIGIYNSAGELVKTVAEKRASDIIGEIKLVKDGNEVNYVNAGAMVEIQIPGVETPDNIGEGMSIFYWDGTNDGGQNVDNGVYYIKVEERDGYGHTNVVIKDISVINVEEYVEVNIYNSAGEKVKTIKENKYFMPEKINLKINDMIILEKTGGEVVVRYGEEPDAYMIWDGRNSKGEIVSNGTYEIQVVTRTSEGKLKYASKTVIILNEATEEIIKEVKAIPNPVYRGGEIKIAWKGQGEGEVKIYVYNTAGELIKRLEGRIEAGEKVWDLRTAEGKPAAEGMYVCVIEAKNKEGYTDREKIKIAIIKK